MTFARVAVIVTGVVLFLAYGSGLLNRGPAPQVVTAAPAVAAAPAPAAAPAAAQQPAAGAVTATPPAGDAGRAQQIALARVGAGTVTKSELENETGRPAWEIEIAHGVTTQDVQVDDATGAVTAVQADNEAAEQSGADVDRPDVEGPGDVDGHDG